MSEVKKDGASGSRWPKNFDPASEQDGGVLPTYLVPRAQQIVTPVRPNRPDGERLMVYYPSGCQWAPPPKL